MVFREIDETRNLCQLSNIVSKRNKVKADRQFLQETPEARNIAQLQISLIICQVEVTSR